MRITRHVWLVVSNDGRALHATPHVLAAFETRDQAKRWAYRFCSTRPQIKKLRVPEWWVAPRPHRRSLKC